MCMAKNRLLNTRYWEDGFIMSLDSKEKLLFLYFLTNPLTVICGVYECPKMRISFDTGINIDDIDKALKKFKNKIHYINGWVYVPNFIKYQALNNPKIIKGIEAEMNNLPLRIKEQITEIDKQDKYSGITNHLSFAGEEEKKKEKKEEENKEVEKQVDEILDCYKEKISKIRITEKSRIKIRARLKEFKKEELLEAIDKFSKDKWRMENNRTNGLDFFFRNEDQVAKWLSLEGRGKQKINI